jgi:predicted transposase/invertase (TIGR01784 family)
VFHKGDDNWQTMPKVYQISLLNFIFDKDDPAAVGHYRMRKNNGHLLSGIQTVIFLELPKIEALGDVPPEDLNSEQKWCKFFLDADNPLKQDYVGKLAAEGGIMEAKKTLDRISSDWVLWKRELDRDVIESDRKTELQFMEEQGMKKGMERGMEKGMKEGMKKGLEQGVVQGTLQTKQEDARNLKRLGVPVQTIIQAVGLSQDEIAQL